MKVFQIVDGKCLWQTNFKTVEETVDKFPESCLFVEAPDYVFEGWGFKTMDSNGNEITGDDRFIKPVAPAGYFYNDATGRFYPNGDLDVMLSNLREEKQAENKAAFTEFLSKHPMLYTDGKYYGVTVEDQSEIQLNMTQYQLQLQAGVENPILEWHAVHEACTPWSVEDLTALVLAISAYVYPWFNLMQDYKAKIYSAETREQIVAVDLVYKTEEELAAENGSEEEITEDTTTEETVVEDTTAEA